MKMVLDITGVCRTLFFSVIKLLSSAELLYWNRLVDDLSQSILAVQRK